MNNLSEKIFKISVFAMLAISILIIILATARIGRNPIVPIVGIMFFTSCLTAFISGLISFFTEKRTMKCQEENCNGKIDMSRFVNLQIGCRSFRNAYPCKKCRRLHFGDGSLVIGRDGHKAFMEFASAK